MAIFSHQDLILRCGLGKCRLPWGFSFVFIEIGLDSWEFLLVLLLQAMVSLEFVSPSEGYKPRETPCASSPWVRQHPRRWNALLSHTLCLHGQCYKIIPSVHPRCLHGGRSLSSRHSVFLNLWAVKKKILSMVTILSTLLSPYSSPSTCEAFCLCPN